MILIGQYDSPFVRRVAIALRLYGLAFQHRPWSTFGDADKIAPFESAAAGADAGVRGRRGADRKHGDPGLSR
jgi:glutathione S-transferase-like protein